MIYLLILVSIIIYLIINVITMKPKHFPPGPPILPIIGSYFYYKRANFHLFLDKLKLKYGPLISFAMYKRTYVFASSPEFILEILKRPEFQGRPKSFIRDSLFDTYHQGIIFNNGPIWTANRRFTFRLLRDYGFDKENVIDHEYGKWKEITLAKGDVHQAQNLFRFATFNVIWRAIAGEPVEYDDPRFSEIGNIMYNFARNGTHFGITIHDFFPFLATFASKRSNYELFSGLVNKITDCFNDVIQKHRDTLDPNHPRDIIDSYLIEMDNKNDAFSEKGLPLMIFDVLLPSFEGLGNTISIMTMYMILYPEIQKKVQNEIDEVLGNDRFSIKDRQRLPYCEAVINETARMTTIIPLGLPHKALSDTTLGGYNIPKGTTLVASIHHLLYDKEHWGDPENFRPDRHINEEGRFIRDEWLLFFGFGKRVCIGESFVRNFQLYFFITLFQDFTICLPEGDPIPSTTTISGVTSTHLPYRMKLIPRRNI